MVAAWPKALAGFQLDIINVVNLWRTDCQRGFILWWFCVNYRTVLQIWESFMTLHLRSSYHEFYRLCEKNTRRLRVPSFPLESLESQLTMSQWGKKHPPGGVDGILNHLGLGQHQQSYHGFHGSMVNFLMSSCLLTIVQQRVVSNDSERWVFNGLPDTKPVPFDLCQAEPKFSPKLRVRKKCPEVH